MNTDITVVSLGPDDPELINIKTMKVLREASCLILSTEKHAAARMLKDEGISYSALDILFEQADNFEDLYSALAGKVLEKASETPVVYAVPDAVTDLSVRQLFLLKPSGIQIHVIPGTGYHDAFLSSNPGFLSDSDLRIISAYEMDEKDFHPGVSTLICEMDNGILAGLVKTRLLDYLNDNTEVLFLHGSEKARAIPLYMLDRMAQYDHRSAVLIRSSGYLERERFVTEDLLQIMDKLRSPGGCPWDGSQTHQSLRQYMIEETWECISCIDMDDMDHLSEELGDLLFQIVFHSSIGKSFDEFTYQDVLSSICKKMIRRHPHVFSGTGQPNADMSVAWEQLKRQEANNETVLESLEDIPVCLPSMIYAEKTYKKLKQYPSFRRSAENIYADLQKSVAEVLPQDGSLFEAHMKTILLLCAELCCALHQDGELLLHQAVDKLKKQLLEPENDK